MDRDRSRNKSSRRIRFPAIAIRREGRRTTDAEVIIVGGGIAGLSAAIYLGRAERDVLVIDAGKSMARWEPHVENFFGFPEGIDGGDLLERGRQQARASGARFSNDEIVKGGLRKDGFVLRGRGRVYRSKRVLLATGAFHIPPEIDGVEQCLGRSMFFCKDCDAFRLRGKRITIYGNDNETVRYALGMLYYSPSVIIVTDGKKPRWDRVHAGWIAEYHIPVIEKRLTGIGRDGCQLKSLGFARGPEVEVDALFTTRGDVYLSKLAKSLGAPLDAEGQVCVDDQLHTSVKGLYAAGCVTPANCQMIIAAGQGAIAAQAINSDLFEESLATHSLRIFRGRQLQTLRATGTAIGRRHLSKRFEAPTKGLRAKLKQNIKARS
jgi:thioredoxin reductase (NADPH)